MALEKEIVNGSYSVGQPLPAEQDLATQFHVSVGTMRRALASLSTRGLISRQRGRGTVVLRTKSSSLNHIASRVGSDPEFIEFSAAIEVVSEAVASVLQISPGSEVILAERLLGLQDGSRIHGTIFWPAAYCLHLRRLSHISVEDWELEYERLGIASGSCIESVTALAASGEVARKLDIASGSAVLRISRIVRTDTFVQEYAIGHCSLKDAEFQFTSG